MPLWVIVVCFLLLAGGAVALKFTVFAEKGDPAAGSGGFVVPDADESLCASIRTDADLFGPTVFRGGVTIPGGCCRDDPDKPACPCRNRRVFMCAKNPATNKYQRTLVSAVLGDAATDLPAKGGEITLETITASLAAVGAPVDYKSKMIEAMSGTEMLSASAPSAVLGVPSCECHEKHVLSEEAIGDASGPACWLTKDGISQFGKWIPAGPLRVNEPHEELCPARA